MPREIYHTNEGDYEGVSDWLTFAVIAVILLAEVAAGWGVWHYCKIKGYL